MAMSKSSYNYNRKSWEDAEFPILCQTCLGDNPYLRMQKDKYGAECKTCERPFTTFRWCPGRNARYKKTEVCQTCSKLKNVCQTCLLDLQYGLPVQVRDYALQLSDTLPKEGANRDFFIQNAERQLAQTDGTVPAGNLADQPPNELLMKLARTQPYYERNRPHICSFWVKGECKRGEECPYRHTKPSDPDDPLSDQNMKDRYYGTKDPVADKMLNRARAMPVLKPPEDNTITTLYLGNLGEEGYISEKDLKNYFYQFGELRNITLLPGKGCGFVQYTGRSSAEQAAEKSFNKLVLKGRRLTIRWGRPQSHINVMMGPDGGKQMDPVPGLPSNTLPGADFFNLSNDAAGPSSSKRPRMQMPGLTQLVPRLPNNMFAAGASGLIVPRLPFLNRPNLAPGSGVRMPPPPPIGGTPAAPPTIHYPSQDPQHLGAKDLQ